MKYLCFCLALLLPVGDGYAQSMHIPRTRLGWLLHTKKYYYNVGGFCDGIATACRNGRYGYIDTNGREVIKCRYARVREFEEGYAVVTAIGKTKKNQVDDRDGIIDANGNLVLPCKYHISVESINNLNHTRPRGQYMASQNEKMGVVTNNGKLLVPCIYKEIVTLNDDWLAVQTDTGAAIINANGTKSLPIERNLIYEISNLGNGLFCLPTNRNGRRGYFGAIDTFGTIAIPYKYRNRFYFKEGLAEVIDPLSGAHGYINRRDSLVIPFQYNDAEDFGNNVAIVSVAGKRGLIDNKGSSLLPCIYTEIRRHNARVFLLQDTNGRRRLFNVNKQPQTTLLFDTVVSDHGGFLRTRRGILWGLIDSSGAEVIPCKYYSLEPIEKRRYLAKADTNNSDKFLLIDSLGNTSQFSLQAEYDKLERAIGNVSSVEQFANGLAVAHFRSRCGYIDTSGKPVIPPIFNTCGSFSSGVAPVTPFDLPRHNEKYLFINKNGHQAFPGCFGYVWDIGSGLFIVEQKKKMGIIDSSGQIVVPIEYDYIHSYLNNVVGGSIDTVSGYFDSQKELLFSSAYQFIKQDNKTIVGYTSDTIYHVDSNWKMIKKVPRSASISPIYYEGIAHYQKHGKYGFIDSNGKKICRAKFVEVNDFAHGYAMVWRKHRGDDKAGIINKKGRLVIPCKFDGASVVTASGHMIVGVNGSQYIVDVHSKKTITSKYQGLYIPNNKNDWVTINNQEACGYMDIYGNWKLRFKK